MAHLQLWAGITGKSLPNRYTNTLQNYPQSRTQMPYLSRARNTGAESRATMKIEMKLTATDFERLWLNAMQWMNHDWEKQADRFDPMPLFSWHYAYWFDNYAALKLAEAFISTLGKNYAIHSDEGTGDWVLLTNYASPCYISKRLVSA